METSQNYTSSSSQSFSVEDSQTQNTDVNECAPMLGYKLIGDNLDKNIRVKYIRLKSHQNASLHFFHLCAVRDRINLNHLPNHHPVGCLHSPHQCALSLLPTVTVGHGKSDKAC